MIAAELQQPEKAPELSKADQSTKAGPLQEGEIQKDGDAAEKKEKQVEFEFEQEKLLKEFKEVTKDGQYKYAISKWKIN